MISHAANGLGHYLISFITYTLLAVGAIYAAFIYLKQNPSLLAFLSRRPQPNGNKKAALSVETMLPLEARKSLYIIRSGDERFLIATSSEGTQFLSKLAPETPDEPVANNPRDIEFKSEESRFQSNVVSEEAVVPMRRIVPVVSSLQGLKSIQQALLLVGAKFLPVFRERFERLQYQFERSSSSRW